MSSEQEFRDKIKPIYRTLSVVFGMFSIIAVMLGVYMINPDILSPSQTPTDYVAVLPEVDEDLIENGIHLRTGLIEAEGLMTVVNNCTNCHSAKLVTQNRMSAERWNATIRWMQETQNLWDLGKNQEVIVNYLVSNYPVKEVGRRAALANIKWYDLED